MASPLASLGLPPPPRYPALTTVAASVMLVNALLLALAFAGSHLARHWQSGDERRLTVQVPQPGLAVEGGGTRRDAVLALLRAVPAVGAARAVPEGELADLLRPFLGSVGESLSLPLPGVIELRLVADLPDPAGLAAQLAARAPGTVLEREAGWLQPVRALLQRLQGAAIALLVLGGLAGSTAVIAVSRAGLAARCDTASLLHRFGATDRLIASYLTAIAARQAVAGVAMGGGMALRALGGLACLTARLAGLTGWPDLLLPATLLAAPWLRLLADIPLGFWAGLLGLGLWLTLLAWTTARLGLRRWLRRQP